MKDGYEATKMAVEAFERFDIPYMVVGGLSSSAHGIPRATKDADLIISADQKKLFQVTDSLAPDFILDAQGTFEMVTGTRRYHLRVPKIAFEIELFLLSDDSHDQKRFERRMRVVSHQIGTTVNMATPEDVIIMKLRWFKMIQRGKDRDDVQNIIAVQGDDILDWAYIHHWCDQHGTRALLDEIRASIPPLD